MSVKGFHPNIDAVLDAVLKACDTRRREGAVYTLKNVERWGSNQLRLGPLHSSCCFSVKSANPAHPKNPW